mgnify:CR=1 FL=1
MRESLSVTDKGKTANTIDNCRIVFCCDPLLRDAIRLNLLTDRVDIVRDLGWRRNTSALTDTDVKYLLLYFEQNYELTSEKKITAALSIVANENCYHPIQDVLNSLVWDGTPRIRSCLHHFLGADESDYVEEMLKHFLLGAIRRVFRPGSKYEEMLCLVGGQGAGKSTFFRLLAIRDEWFSDDLKKLDDDRVFQKLQGHWIIEMSEMLATSSAKSIEEIRSFISRQKETYRTPYESQPKDRLRQCVFGGSSNTLDFLPLDRAGNRRFLPIMIYSENAEVHILEDEDASRAYLLQVWAEAMTIYRSGQYSMKFSKSIQRQLVEVQKDFMPEDTEAGQIQGFLEHYTGNMVCSKQLLKEAGAAEVHMRISSPPLKYPCFYGIDISTTKELIAAKKSVEEIREYIGADSLAFLSLDGLVESIGLGADAPYGGLCVAYFNGDYPTALDDYEADFLKSLTPEDRVRLPEFALYKSKYEGNEYTTTSPQEEH